MQNKKIFQEAESEYDVNIIIGENGSGKSNYLNELANEFIKSGKKVIAIATSIHDKFDISSSKFNFFGGRQGRNMVEKLVKKSLHTRKLLDVDRIKHLVRALEYSGYEARIGIKVEGYSYENKNLIEHYANIPIEDKYQIINILENHGEDFGHVDLPHSGRLLNINLSALSTGIIQETTLSSILKHERILKKLKIISSISLYLEKNQHIVPLNNASSGELMIISTLVHISSSINVNSVIIIDEPENSLHPKWQKEYIDKILDLFYQYSPKIIIATHSPLVIPLSNQNPNLFRLSNYELEEISNDSSNNEELMSEVFGIITPENRYLSDLLVNLINDFDSDQKSYPIIIDMLNELKNKIYDMRQSRFINGVRRIIDDMHVSKVEKNG